MENTNRYVAIIEKIFSSHFRKGMEEVPFSREEIDLPPDVDIENTVEYFKNGILEITFPKKKLKR